MTALAALFGALFGALRARNRGGDRWDIAQYAVVHAILFGLIALFLALVIYPRI